MLHKVRMEAGKNNLCLFSTVKVICLLYVDDCLFFAPKPSDMVYLLTKIKAEGMSFNIENNDAGLLGVTIECKTESNTIMLTQTDLIVRTVDALGLNNARLTRTSSEVALLGKDPNRDRGNAAFIYMSIIGMMLCLSNHSCPDIQFAVM
eukprot:8538724-Ditylum_brightwellii.AAC.1